MFSNRTRWNREANRLAQALETKRREGAPLFDLTESNPTRVGLPYPHDLLAVLADPRALEYEPSPRGLSEAREAVAADYRRRGLEVEPARLLLTASTSEAYSFVFKLLCDSGDRVLAPRPSYPLFEYLGALETVEVDHYPLSYDGEWHLSVSTLAAAVTPRTRAVVVVNPNNPTGSYLKRDEASALYAFCADRGIALVCDEVFADYAFRADPGRIISLAADGAALAFALGGLSKSCGLPQLKLGWIAVSGPVALREEALARLEIVADTYLSVGTPVQRAAPALLARRSELQSPIAARVRANREALQTALGHESAATLLRAEGGWCAVLQVPSTRTEEEWVVGLLERENVLVHPGYFFDFTHEAYLVLSLLPAPDVFATGVERVLRAVGETAGR